VNEVPAAERCQSELVPRVKGMLPAPTEARRRWTRASCISEHLTSAGERGNVSSAATPLAVCTQSSSPRAPIPMRMRLASLLRVWSQLLYLSKSHEISNAIS
jgi:hypothetical protein